MTHIFCNVTENLFRRRVTAVGDYAFYIIHLKIACHKHGCRAHGNPLDCYRQGRETLCDIISPVGTVKPLAKSEGYVFAFAFSVRTLRDKEKIIASVMIFFGNA